MAARRGTRKGSGDDFSRSVNDSRNDHMYVANQERFERPGSTQFPIPSALKSCGLGIGEGN
jgi:hypothetical protein